MIIVFETFFQSLGNCQVDKSCDRDWGMKSGIGLKMLHPVSYLFWSDFSPSIVKNSNAAFSHSIPRNFMSHMKIICQLIAILRVHITPNNPDRTAQYESVGLNKFWGFSINLQSQIEIISPQWRWRNYKVWYHNRNFKRSFCIIMNHYYALPKNSVFGRLFELPQEFPRIQQPREIYPLTGFLFDDYLKLSDTIHSCSIYDFAESLISLQFHVPQPYYEEETPFPLHRIKNECFCVPRMNSADAQCKDRSSIRSRQMVQQNATKCPRRTWVKSRHQMDKNGENTFNRCG